MSDLTPPPRRRLSEDRKNAMSAMLANEVGDGGRGNKPVLPWIAAAVAAGLAVGAVYAYHNHQDGRQPPPGPAGSGPTTTFHQSTKPTATSATTRPTPPPVASESHLIKHPAPSYAKCVKLIGKPGLAGRIAVTNGKVTTVVVSDGTNAYTCNIKPDSAVSNPSPDQPVGSVTAKTFAFALNDARNYHLRGDLTWVGGRLPTGVTSLTYVFLHGHRVAATTHGSYWVMQDLANPGWTRPNGNISGKQIQVELDGPGGKRTITVPLGVDTICNQVSHGC